MTTARTAIVTGAASGIGKATVRLLAEQGWVVGSVDLDATTRPAPPAGCRGAVIDLAADVTNYEAVAATFEAFKSQAGTEGLDLLVNCAGLLHTGHFEEHDPENVARLLSVNNLGVAHCCRAALPQLLESARRARRPAVVNLSSASSAAGIPSMAVYSASKFWVRGFTDALACEWTRFGIAVRDTALRTVARCVNDCIRRPGDFAGRYGGEEFCALLPNTDLAGAQRVAEAIRAAVLAADEPNAGSAHGKLTVSVGIAVHWVEATTDDTPSDLLQVADHQLYEAKAAGRNTIMPRQERLRLAVVWRNSPSAYHLADTRPQAQGDSRRGGNLGAALSPAPTPLR